MKKIGLLISIVLLACIAASLWATGDVFQAQRAASSAALAAEYAPEICDYGYFASQTRLPHLYRRAIHVSTLSVWDPATSKWTRSIAWADSLEEVSYDSVALIYYDKFAFGRTLAGEINVTYYPSEAEGVAYETDCTIYWNKNGESVERFEEK